MTLLKSEETVILAVLDGWGIAQPSPGNAISLAKTPNMNSFWSSYPHTQLGASGEVVGLPRGEEGNSETGHVNLGAGRIVYQYLARINMSIADGTFFRNPALLGAIDHVRKNGTRLHFMGLVGSGGVHSSIEHLFALIQLASRHKLENVFIHAFTDGRDSPPNVGASYIKKIEELCQREGVGKIASVMGRYWAMDRDRRWDRTAKAYFALTKGEGVLVNSPHEAVELSYSKGTSDEFVEPSLVVGEDGKPIGLIRDNDALVFFNFRIDRPRQLSRAFIIEDVGKSAREWDFDPYLEVYNKKGKEEERFESPMFDRGPALKNLYFVIMTEYESPLVKAGAKAAFSPEVITMPVGRVISLHDLRQLRVSESEKERFIGYYFNGRRDAPFTGEERVIIPSPKVPTYDLKPEMAAYEITEAMFSKLKEERCSFVLINFANADMVGHTGNIAAAKIAVEAVDACLGKIANFILEVDGYLVITSDHGNAEEMIALDTGEMDTEHSANPVPFIVVSRRFQSQPEMLTSGILGDVGPTILGLLGIETPSSMSGRDLLKDLRT